MIQDRTDSLAMFAVGETTETSRFLYPYLISVVLVQSQGAEERERR